MIGDASPFAIDIFAHSAPRPECCEVTHGSLSQESILSLLGILGVDRRLADCCCCWGAAAECREEDDNLGMYDSSGFAKFRVYVLPRCNIRVTTSVHISEDDVVT